jgi:hypothetical protein
MNGSRKDTESLPEVWAKIHSRELVAISYPDTLQLRHKTERDDLRKVCRGWDQSEPSSNTLPRSLVREPNRKFAVGILYVIPAY